MSSTAASPSTTTATPLEGVVSLRAGSPDIDDLAERLDAVLPQTQCTRCGYPDCRGYARALAEGRAELNQCPPGGAEGVRRLAALLDRPVLPLNAVHGTEGPRQVVFVDERTCIGCTLCIQACPVDAIIGAPKRMHIVLEEICTGCELCLPACPVDCLVLENASGDATGWAAWSDEQAAQARIRYERHRERAGEHAPGATSPVDEPGDASLNPTSVPARDARAVASNAATETSIGSPPRQDANAPATDAIPAPDKKATIEAALARARLRAKMRAP